MSITPWGFYGREVTARTSRCRPAVQREHHPWSVPCWLLFCRSRGAIGRLGRARALAARVARAQAAVCTEDWRWPQTDRLVWAFPRAGVAPKHSRMQTATLQIEHQSSYVTFQNSFLTYRNDWCTLAPVERHGLGRPDSTGVVFKPRHCSAAFSFRQHWFAFGGPCGTPARVCRCLLPVDQPAWFATLSLGRDGGGFSICQQESHNDCIDRHHPLQFQ